jgi:curved DNA-binding protein
MAFIDYYKILGVEKTIPQKDVKRAYLKRAKQFHPDLHPDDPKAKAKFLALNEAYDVIGDPEKRKKYDQYGEQWRQADAFNGGGASGGFGGFGTGGAGGGSPFEGFDFSSFTSGGGGFSSFFENLFGGGRSGRRQQGTASRSQSSSIDIPLVLALTGGDVLVNTPSGDKVKLKVKPCTQPGTKVRLPGKGQGGRDLILTYNVRLPDSLTPQQQALLRQALG